MPGWSLCCLAADGTKRRRFETPARLDRTAPSLYCSKLFRHFRKSMDRAKTTTLTGAEIVVRCLQEEGVE